MFLRRPAPRLRRGAGAPWLAARATKPFAAFATLGRLRSSPPAPGTCGFRGPRPRPRLVSLRSFASRQAFAALRPWSCSAASEPFGFLGGCGSHLRRLPSRASKPFGAFAALRRRRSSSPAPGTCGFRVPAPRAAPCFPTLLRKPCGLAPLAAEPCRLTRTFASLGGGLLGGRRTRRAVSPSMFAVGR